MFAMSVYAIRAKKERKSLKRRNRNFHPQRAAAARRDKRSADETLGRGYKSKQRETPTF